MGAPGARGPEWLAGPLPLFSVACHISSMVGGDVNRCVVTGASALPLISHTRSSRQAQKFCWGEKRERGLFWAWCMGRGIWEEEEEQCATHQDGAPSRSPRPGRAASSLRGRAVDEWLLEVAPPGSRVPQDLLIRWLHPLLQPTDSSDVSERGGGAAHHPTSFPPRCMFPVYFQPLTLRSPG